MLVSAKEMTAAARAGHYAIGAFNLNNLEWTKAVLKAAQECQAPVIVQCSEGAGKYMAGYKTVVDMVNDVIASQGITVPVALHLDHGSYEGCLKCIDAGFSSSTACPSRQRLAASAARKTALYLRASAQIPKSAS